MTKGTIYGIIDVKKTCSVSKGDRKLKVAIYCRLSEEDKNKQFETDDSGSIQNQKALLEERTKLLLSENCGTECRR